MGENSKTANLHVANGEYNHGTPKKIPRHHPPIVGAIDIVAGTTGVIVS